MDGKIRRDDALRCARAAITALDKFRAAGETAMNRYPSIWTLRHLVDYANKGECQAGLPDGRWVPARPLGFCSLGQRIKAAKLVFTGKADAVTWPGQ